MSGESKPQRSTMTKKQVTTVTVVSSANNSEELKSMLEQNIGHLPVENFRLQEIQSPRTDIKMFLLFKTERA